MSNINDLVNQVLLEGKLGRFGATVAGLGGGLTGGGVVGAHMSAKHAAATGKSSGLRTVGSAFLGSIPVVGAVSNYINHKTAEDIQKAKDEQNKKR